MRSNDNGLNEDNVFTANGMRLLKSKAIYGSNASGKSNLAEAIMVFSKMVRRSVAEEGLSNSIWLQRFQLITDWDEQPVYFQYLFLMEGKMYRYGFEILNNAVSREWLFGAEEGQEANYFLREPGNQVTTNKELLGMAEHNAVYEENELYRSDALFLTAGALNSSKFLKKIRDKIYQISLMGGDTEATAFDLAKNVAFESSEYKKAIRDFLASANTSIDEIEVENSAEKNRDSALEALMPDSRFTKALDLYAVHSVYDWEGKRTGSVRVPFEEWESQGTHKLFGIASMVIYTLKHGLSLLIDELDARLHPNLTLKIVQLFNNPETNSKNAQLIFVTHDTGLLRRAKLRRDQICIVNKDRYGISEATTLIEFKGVRKDTSYEKEYLNGAYAGIPFLGQLDEAIKAATTPDV